VTVRIDVVRSGLTESVHEASLVMIDAADGPAQHWGPADVVAFARSALKPLQATAMVRTGLRLRSDLLAIACSSHNAELPHIAAVSEVLAQAGLDPSFLRCPPALPRSGPARVDYLRAGGTADSLHHECSGKHSAMLATCALNGWPLESYLEPDHPLQAAIRDTVEDLTGDVITASGVDGCGAPTHAVTLVGLARAFSRLAVAGIDDPDVAGTDVPDGAGIDHPDGAAGAAMRAFPQLIGGDGRDVTAAMQAAPGLIVKDGAEGIYGLALPDGRAAAFKIHDGSLRAAPPLVLAVLRRWGVPVEPTAWGEPAVLGRGKPVGSIRLRRRAL
jgi:L-asparaginase II